MPFIIIAGGCFWGLEELFSKRAGVTKTEVGYCGGHIKAPTYPIVSSGDSGHAEAVKVVFNPKVTTHGSLFDFFFSVHDPTTQNQQGNDVGPQYRSAIFYQNEDEHKAAKESLQRAQAKWPSPIVTELLPLDTFYPAEDFHQKYLQKNPLGYSCHFPRYEVTDDGDTSGM